MLPDFVGERVAHDASVPVLVTDEGEIVSEARSIVAWAEQHPTAAVATPVWES